jgi:membrane associated rhomboid family serine protease
MYSTPPLTQTNKFILIIAAITFVLVGLLRVYSGVDLTSELGLSVSGILSGKVYQLITYPFVEGNLLSMLFNGLLFWMIGGELELTWGSFFYRKLLGLNVLICSLVYLVISFLFLGQNHSATLIGLYGLSSSLLTAYAMIFSERMMTIMFLFPIKAKYLALIYLGILLYSAITSPYSTGIWAHLSGIIFTYFYLKALSNRANPRPKKKKKTHLSIVKDEQEQPKYWH